jgi:hypothetical protein
MAIFDELKQAYCCKNVFKKQHFFQFSFLGQIYAKKSLKKQYRRHSSSLRWPRGTNPTSGMTITTNPLVPDMDLPSTDQKRFAVFAIETEEEEDEIVNK